MKKIKILYGLEAVGGGAFKHLKYLISNIDQDLFDVTVILSSLRNENVENELDEIESYGVKVILLPIVREIKFFNDHKNGKKILSIMRDGKFNVVHAHSSKAGALFRLAARINSRPVKVLYTPHSFYFQGKKGIRRWIYVLLERILAKFTDGIIVSDNEKVEILKEKICKESKIININNAIDFNDYRQSRGLSKIKEQYKIPQKSKVVGSIGRLTLQKDWKTFIYAAREVLKRHPDTVFLIVGEGEQFMTIKKLVYRLGLDKNVFQLGHIKEIHKIYGIIDVFVNTSLWEGLPYVFLEAMHHRKPIVATSTGSGAVVLHEENGFVSPVKDHQSIANQILKLISNNELALKMGRYGNEILEQKYSFELFIKNHEKLYYGNERRE